MFRILISMSLVVLWIFATAIPGLAQQDSPGFCADLSVEDCQLLGNSASAMSRINSGVTESHVSMLLQDIPDMPFSELAFEYNTNVGFQMDPAVEALIERLQTMNPADLEALSDDPSALLSMLRTLFTGLQLGLDLELQMSEALALILSEEMRNDIGMDLPQELGLRLMIVDGVLFVDMGSVASIVPDVGAFFEGWVGVEAAPLLDMAEAELFGTVGVDDSAAASMGSGNAMGGVSIGMSGPAVTTIEAVDPNGDILDFLMVERIEDEDEDLATFVTNVDYPTFFQSPVFRQLVLMVTADQGLAMSEEELDETVTLAQIMGPSLLQGLTLELVEVIGESDSYLYDSDLLLEWDLHTLLTLAGQSDPSLKVDEDAEPFFGLWATTSNDLLNEEVEILAPEGAFIMPTSMIMQFLNQ